MTAPRGSLTGSARVLNDVIVSFHNTIQNWKSSLIGGVKIIQTIQENVEAENVVEKCCEEMGKLIESMQRNVNVLKECSSKVQNLTVLNKNSPSPCYTWSYDQVAKSMRVVTDAYEEDTVFKEKITHAIQGKTLEQINIIAVFWVHSGQINSYIDTTLEAILRECSLK